MNHPAHQAPHAAARLRATLGAHRGWSAVAFLALAVLVVATFRPVLDHEFVSWDDGRYNRDNPMLRSFDAASVEWMLTDTSLFYWHPLAYAFHTAQNVLFGDDPGARHAVSMALHALNVWLVFLLLAALAGSREKERAAVALGAAFAAAALFAVHPLRTESVAWASEQKGLLCAFFCLASVLAWLLYATGRSPARFGWYAASLAGFVLALMSKPLGVVVPAVLLILDAWPLGRFRRGAGARRPVLDKLPFLVPAIWALSLSVADPRQDELMPDLTAAGLAPRLTVATWGILFPLARTLWFPGLEPYYPLEYAEDVSLLAPKYGLSALALFAITAWCVFRRRRGRPALLVAWACYLLAVLPVSGLRQAGSVATADRFSYLPAVALFALLAGGVVRTWPRLRAPGRAALAGAGVLCLVVWALAAREELRPWRDSETFWTAVLRAWPGRVVVAHNNLGALYHQRGLREGDDALLMRAVAQYRAALRLREDHASSWNNLGKIHDHLGESGEAEACYLRALGHRPDFSVAHANLAVLYLRLGEPARARPHYRRAMERPERVDPLLRKILREHLGPPGGGR